MSLAATSWYALLVHARSEQRAARELMSRVDEVFLPVKRERRAWSDRVVTSELALFPGYVFVRTVMSAARRIDIKKAHAVHDVIGGFGDRRIASAIPDEQVQALRIVIEADRALDPIERLVRGRHIVVATGALRGARGIVEQGPDGQRRLIVQIELLGRGVRAVLAADDIVLNIEVAA